MSLAMAPAHLPGVETPPMLLQLHPETINRNEIAGRRAGLSTVVMHGADPSPARPAATGSADWWEHPLEPERASRTCGVRSHAAR